MSAVSAISTCGTRPAARRMRSMSFCAVRQSCPQCGVPKNMIPAVQVPISLRCVAGVAVCILFARLMVSFTRRPPRLWATNTIGRRLAFCSLRSLERARRRLRAKSSSLSIKRPRRPSYPNVITRLFGMSSVILEGQKKPSGSLNQVSNGCPFNPCMQTTSTSHGLPSPGCATTEMPYRSTSSRLTTFVTKMSAPNGSLDPGTAVSVALVDGGCRDRLCQSERPNIFPKDMFLAVSLTRFRSHDGLIV